MPYESSIPVAVTAQPDQAPQSEGGNRTLSIVVASALFLENMDSNVLSVALPTIARELHEDPLTLKLALTAYLLSLAVFIPLSGWIADRYGARRVFAASIAVFLTGSIACTLARSPEGLVLARILQGAGGAMMVPVGRLIVVRGSSKSELVQAMAWLTMPALLGPISGPLVGGFIVTHWDWRWIFLINIPFGLIGIVLGLRLIPDDGVRDLRALDIMGFCLSGVMLTSIMAGSIASERLGVWNGFSLALLFSGLAFGWLTWRHSSRSSHPLIDLALFAIPTYRMAILGGFLFRMGVGAVPFLMPLMLQIGFGLDALHSGMITFVTAIGAMFMKPINVFILRVAGFRMTLFANGLLAAASIGSIALIKPDTPYGLIYPLLFLGGCCRSVQFSSLNALAFSDIEPERLSSATSLAAALQQVAVSMGVTIGAAVLDLGMFWRGQTTLIPWDFALAFMSIGIILMVVTPCFLLLAPDAGSAVSGNRRGPAVHGS